MYCKIGNKMGFSEQPDGQRIPVSDTAAKKPYSKPGLECYGKVNTLTQNGGGSVSDGTGNSMSITMGSDSRIKENIVRIGDHPLGIGLYLFDYKPGYRDVWGHGRQFGVMAQEVETVLPAAVDLHPDGYKTVNYTMLGITRTTH